MAGVATVEQRRRFAGFRVGTQVPGYAGYIPHLKYDMSRTYGTSTHQLSQETRPHRELTDLSKFKDKWTFALNIPEPENDKKYSQYIVPGYTGYIPRMPFKFGGTYKENYKESIDEFVNNKESYEKKVDGSQHQNNLKKLTAVCTDSEVINKLNSYSANSKQSIFTDDKRQLLEPPMPGYKGFVPKIQPTDIGLGCRYHEMTKKALHLFWSEALETQTSKLSSVKVQSPTKYGNFPVSSKRLYLNTGMIPKYTGYVPQHKYTYGNTYGNTTRQLEACAHDKTCYGDYKKHKSRLSAT